jgi:hypothetical protein
VVARLAVKSPKALAFAIAASLVLTAILVLINNHTPLPYDPNDKGFIIKNFVRIALN